MTVTMTAILRRDVWVFGCSSAAGAVSGVASGASTAPMTCVEAMPADVA